LPPRRPGVVAFKNDLGVIPEDEKYAGMSEHFR
jgi:hypothetical protein